jgi:hypothetical protein
MADKSEKMDSKRTAHTFTEHTASMVKLRYAYTVLTGNLNRLIKRYRCKWRI